MSEKDGDDAETTVSAKNNKFIVWEALKSIIFNNIDYYKNDESSNGLKIHAAMLGIIDQLDIARPLICDVEDFCKLYDFDVNTQGNGYRSFLKVFDSAINHTLRIVKYVTEARSSFLFRKSTYTKEIDACNHLLAALVTILNHLIALHSSSENGNLFPVHSHSPEEVVERAKTVNQFAFYGRCLGFQYCDSIKPVQKFLGIAMASYSEAYYSCNGNFIKATNSMFTSGKYFLDPELRAKRIVSISQNSSVEFCKSFWFLAENEIMNVISSAYQKVRVNRVIKVKTEKLKISNEIELPEIGHIQVRLISSHEREGMIKSDKKESKRKKCQVLPKSKSLCIHLHGGGFVAQSSQSHLLYLDDWAEQLNVPILSVDYSLAPEAPYPIALNEVFYIYCWAMKNATILGSTCENIVLVGDSAGANLCLATTLKCIDLKIRKPDGVFIAYCPVLVAFDPSPSRMLCMMDPLIPFGFLMRCLKAYSNAESFTNHQQHSEEVGGEYYYELEEMKRAKAVHNEELKRKSSMNNELNNEMEFSNDDDDKSDSFEEISCFERHQTDSNLQAHISPVSEIASNDTLAEASFITNTDNRNSNLNDTIEIESPIDSIKSATSLEDDSLPITIQKKESGDDDLAATTSSHYSDDINKKYVDEFIEKYVLDAKQCDDGMIQPVLRKSSKTKSEENVVFDISRDTLRMKSFQHKFQRVASSLVDTLSEITKTNRPITRNLSCDDDEVRTIDNDSCGVPESSSSEFIFNVPKDPFLSPIYADDDALSQFPAINILTLSLDPCLDDSIEFAKKLRDLNVKVKLDVLDGLPHGFLNFSKLSNEAHNGSKLSVARIAELLNITLDKDETKVKYFC